MPQPPAAIQPKERVSQSTLILLPVLAFVIVTLARIVYVSLYASPLPFWDQWDELDRQIRPWFYGGWHFLQLFAPHNQHRIAFTRVISLLLAGVNNRVFDNLVLAYANTLIYAAMWGTALTLLVRDQRNRSICWLIAGAVVALGVLPFDWGNTLVGFQNQFYLLEFGAVVLTGIVAYHELSVGTIVLLTVLAVANLVTMASGLLAAPAAGFALILCAWQKPVTWRRLVTALALLALVAIIGLVLLDHSRGVATLHAKDAGDFFHGLRIALMWPLETHPDHPTRWVFTALLWAPSLIWLVLFYRTHRAERSEIVAVTLAGWVFLQCMAVGYSRGHDMNLLAPRYSEITALGIAANTWLALKLVTRRGAAWWGRVVVVVAGILVAYVFWRRTPGDLAAMRQRHVFTTIETRNVERYLAGIPLPALPEGSLDIPYPVAARLRILLGNPEIRRMMAPAILPAGQRTHAAPLSRFARATQSFVRAAFPADAWVVAPSQLAAATPTTFRPYRSALPAIAPNRECSLDVIDNKPSTRAPTVSPRSTVTFGGWMGNGHLHPVARGIFILQGSTESYSAKFFTGVARPDVAAALHSKPMERSGYNLTAVLDRVAAGTYALFATAAGDPSELCDLHRTLTVLRHTSSSNPTIDNEGTI
ncbi:MAG TPA: hypothetical protein VF292_02535 [Rhodanobacteraceae bacterium]